MEVQETPSQISVVRRHFGLLTNLRRAPLIPTFIIFAFTLASIFGNILAPHDAYTIDLSNRFRPPFWLEGGSTSYLLGTDQMGRDVLSRIIVGARVSLIVSLLAITVGGTVGLVMGLLSGFLRGKWDAVVMRAADATIAMPIIFLALLLAVSLGPRFTNVIIALSIVLWARYARVIRGEVLALRERDFIAQARIAGCSDTWIIIHHLFPNVVNTWVVLLTLQIGWCILVEATLSFLGAGIPPPAPAWGSMAAWGRGYITSAWWVCIFPGVAIMVVVLGFNLFGDWLRDTLDPKRRQV